MTLPFRVGEAPDLLQEVLVPDVSTPKDRSTAQASATLVAGATLVGLVIMAAVVSLLWTPYSPTSIDPSNALLSPGSRHWLGTDFFGRDEFSQVLVGARMALYVGVISVAIAATLGIPLGVMAAAFDARGYVRETIMRLMDVILGFPAILLAIVLAAAYGASTLTAMIAIGLATAPVFARLSRATALQVLGTDYILVARSYGKRGVPLLMRHVLPNIAAPLIVQASMTFAVAILAEAALAYLGFGTPPPTPSWGRMLQESQTYLQSDALLALWPGLAILLAVLGFNLLGDGLRDALDPKLRGR